MADFKPVIGYLALAARVGILPVYLHGTYEAFPKGSTLLKSRDVSARIGRFIEIDELEAITTRLAAGRGLPVDCGARPPRSGQPARPNQSNASTRRRFTNSGRLSDAPANCGLKRAMKSSRPRECKD